MNRAILALDTSELESTFINCNKKTAAVAKMCLSSVCINTLASATWRLVFQPWEALSQESNT